MTLKPLSDRVVVTMVEVEETTKSGIILTASAKEKPQVAEVIAVGPGAMQDGKLVIVVEETVNSKAKSTIEGTPCCVLEIDHDHMPLDFLIVSTSGEEFNSINE